jgi:dsRNA-specific ribonuclease
LTGTGKSKKLAKRQAAHKMWEKLQDSPISSSSIMPGLDDDDEVCAGSRMEFSLSVVLVTALVFGRCCMPSMHMTFTVPVACSLCSAL